jgi:hypothetical protein
MDPVTLSTLIGSGVVGVILITGFTLFIRALKKQGAAKEVVKNVEKSRDDAEKAAAELAKPRSYGRALLDRLQALGRKNSD